VHRWVPTGLGIGSFTRSVLLATALHGSILAALTNILPRSDIGQRKATLVKAAEETAGPVGTTAAKGAAILTNPPCFLTDKCYRSDIVSSRENVTRVGAVYKRQIGSLWLRDGLEEHLLDVIDLRAQGNKV
jgi:hypothetical protein